MVKKYTAKDHKRILLEVISNGYYHIAAINNEIAAMKIDDPTKATPEQKDKLRALTLTLTLINDLIHPAHKASYSLMKEKSALIDYCVKAQQVALENKLIDPCFCTECREDEPQGN